MTPYYTDDTVTIYHGDAREVLPTLPRASVDLLIADPPYGVSWQSGWRRAPLERIAGDDGTLDVPAALGLSLPVLREFRHLYVFGRHDLAALPLASPVELIWDKDILGPGDLSLPWGPAHEPITFAVFVPSRANRADGRGRLAARLRRGSIIRCPRRNACQVSDHPTEKPVDLLRQLIESSSVLGETVLDPFAGAGSTLVAAQLEGRRAVGIEVDERYCETAARRLSQPPLFAATARPEPTPAPQGG